VHGLVWEWTLDPWTESYAGRENGVTLDPAALDADAAAREAQGGGWRVIRGGSYWNASGMARAAFRHFSSSEIESVNQGFRVVLPRPRVPQE
jgi:formylglycine-generating enzyme required for sulfatase activity